MSNARAFLDLCMTRAPSPPELAAFIAAKPPEMLHHDFKNGAELATKDAPHKLRANVSGFANADGGVLIYGVEDKTLALTDAQAPGGQSLTSWATNVLDPLRGWLIPPVRIWDVVVDEHHVLLVACARTPRLVPVFADGGERFFLRMGDSTKPVPDYLLSDLTLGRRQHPVLEAHEAEYSIESITGTTEQRDARVLNVEFAVRVINHSPQWVRGAAIGIVHPMTRHGRPLMGVSTMVDLESSLAANCHLLNQNVVELAPFVDSRFTIGCRIEEQTCDYSAAIYVLCDGSPPDWYSFEDSLNAGRSQERGTKRISVSRVPPGSRPRISSDASEIVRRKKPS